MAAPVAPAAPAARRSNPPWEHVFKVWGIPVFLVVSLGALFMSCWLGGEKGLEIVAALGNQRVIGDSTVWVIEGRVLQEGQPAESAYVWVVARESQGNRAAPPGQVVDSEARFTVGPIPRFIGGKAVTEVTIFATRGSTRGGETLAIGDKGAVRSVALSVWRVVWVPIVFLLSVLVALVKMPAPWKYGITLVLSAALTVGMIVLIISGLTYVNNTDRTETISLGFASLFRGYYVGGTSEEWLVSLSSPQWVADGEGKVVTGFGAPLWVILISVIGAGLVTIALIVQEISDGLPVEDGAAAAVAAAPVAAGQKRKHRPGIRDRLEGIVRHEFFIMFSPIGAIFIYQALVLAKAAAHPFSVAIAALGAGAALNGLLDKAVQVSQGLLKEKPPQG